ncbi:MAG: hypothetical protein PHQ12_11875 [Chthoniobacteraceae bacterium]|nr:hypothetical protein [Chthoniobacteraceae bacterium]
MESILTGRASISRDTSPAAKEPSSGFRPLFVPTPPAPPVVVCEEQGEPQIEVVNGKNGIESIIITCTCGKRIELKCEYD